MLVHSGDMNAGHYFALIRPERFGGWFRFDDDRVIPASSNDVLDANFGGVKAVSGRRGYTNAYMLVYVRVSDEAEVLEGVGVEDVPLYLRERVDLEEKERGIRAIEEMERHLFMDVEVVIDREAVGYGGFDVGFGEIGRRIRVKKESRLSDFLVSFGNVRGWSVVVRQNKTFRFEAPFDVDMSKALV